MEKDRQCYGPYLAQLRPEKLAVWSTLFRFCGVLIWPNQVITVHHALSKMLEKPEGVDFSDVALGIGDLVQLEVSHERLCIFPSFRPPP